MYKSLNLLTMKFVMKEFSINFLRLAIIFLGLAVLAFCVFALPAMLRGASAEFPEAAWSVFLIIGGLYATAIPFYIALWQIFKLLHYIDKKIPFSNLSFQAVKNIKYCVISIAILYVGGVPLLLPIAEADDAPGIILMGMFIAGAPVVAAVFTAVLQKVLQNAIDLQSENDLTV